MARIPGRVRGAGERGAGHDGALGMGLAPPDTREGW